jgi:hypothetical protein
MYTVDELRARVRANVTFFKFTYTACCLAITTSFVLSSPVLLCLGIALSFMWMWVLRQSSEVVTTIAGKEYGSRERYLFAVIVTTVYVLLFGVISTVSYIVLVNGLVIGCHAALREPVVLDELDVMAEESDAIMSASADTGV